MVVMVGMGCDELRGVPVCMRRGAISVESTTDIIGGDVIRAAGVPGVPKAAAGVEAARACEAVVVLLLAVAVSLFAGGLLLLLLVRLLFFVDNRMSDAPSVLLTSSPALRVHS